MTNSKKLSYFEDIVTKVRPASLEFNDLYISTYSLPHSIYVYEYDKIFKDARKVQVGDLIEVDLILPDNSDLFYIDRITILERNVPLKGLKPNIEILKLLK